MFSPLKVFSAVIFLIFCVLGFVCFDFLKVTQQQKMKTKSNSFQHAFRSRASVRIPDFRGISMLTTRNRGKICFCIIFRLFLLSVCRCFGRETSPKRSLTRQSLSTFSGSLRNYCILIQIENIFISFSRCIIIAVIKYCPLMMSYSRG